jgi:hypothetical protein
MILIAVLAFVVAPVCIWPHSSGWFRFSMIAALAILARWYLGRINSDAKHEIWEALEPGESYVWVNDAAGLSNASGSASRASKTTICRLKYQKWSEVD